MNQNPSHYPCHLCGELEHAHEMRVNIQNGAALCACCVLEHFEPWRDDSEVELNARYHRMASEALCRFVIERVKAESVWGDEAFKRFRRALISQLQLLNRDFENLLDRDGL